MSDHALAESLAGLASRLDDLSHKTQGETSRTLEEYEDRITKLTLAAIAQEMDATNEKYQDTVHDVRDAIAAIQQADKKIEKIASTIALVAKAVDAAEGLLKKSIAV